MRIVRFESLERFEQSSTLLRARAVFLAYKTETGTTVVVKNRITGVLGEFSEEYYEEMIGGIKRDFLG